MSSTLFDSGEASLKKAGSDSRSAPAAVPFWLRERDSSTLFLRRKAPEAEFHPFVIHPLTALMSPFSTFGPSSRKALTAFIAMIMSRACAGEEATTADTAPLSSNFFVPAAAPPGSPISSPAAAAPSAAFSTKPLRSIEVIYMGDWAPDELRTLDHTPTPLGCLRPSELTVLNASATSPMHATATTNIITRCFAIAPIIRESPRGCLVCLCVPPLLET
mmetsp:Transcript_4738/g.10926  ORF Transcript_4738/g.10926 Transcript_4738/m.10926 type:complete len:218 (-) Transcript_4738:62-715(-)